MAICALLQLPVAIRASLYHILRSQQRTLALTSSRSPSAGAADGASLGQVVGATEGAELGAPVGDPVPSCMTKAQAKSG